MSEKAKTREIEIMKIFLSYDCEIILIFSSKSCMLRNWKQNEENFA